MFKKTILIDSNELENIAEELGYEYESYYPVVQELDASVENGECSQEYKLSDMKSYQKYYSKMAVEILGKFFEKHKCSEFTIVATY